MYLTSNAGGAFHLWRQRFPDGSPEQLTSGPTEEEGIAVAPDGRSLVTAVGTTQSSVWVHGDAGDRQVSLEGQASNPRFTPDGKRLCYRIRTGTASELWVADLETNHAEPLLPGFPIAYGVNTGARSHPGFDISPDGQRVAFFSHGRDGSDGLWVASLDRRSSPRQVLAVQGENAVFGSGGEIFFRKLEGSSAFLYSVREDGTGLHKAAAEPILGVFGSDPSRKWLLLGESAVGEVLFPVDGGVPVPLRMGPPEWIGWSGDGKSLFICRGHRATLKGYVVPLPPGRILPPGLVTADGVIPEPELSKLSGARPIPAVELVPGASAGLYAYTRETVQRNLYRIPLR
jgi:hypothetical protein